MSQDNVVCPLAAPQPDKLDILFKMQTEFGKKFTEFPTVSEDMRQFVTLDFIDHLVEELIELRRELPIRKHWSAKRSALPDWDKVKVEYADAMHFFISIALINGWSSQDVFDAYCAKHDINEQRQQEGY